MAGLERDDGLLARYWGGACVRQRTSLWTCVSITGRGRAVGRPCGSRQWERPVRLEGLRDQRGRLWEPVDGGEDRRWAVL